MTTLHEETSLRNIPLQEENEDSYSDAEYDYDSKQTAASASSNDYYAKSRMRSSHTIDSFMDIEKKTSTTSTNLLNYKLLTQHQPFHVQQATLTTTMTATTSTKPLKNGKLESVIAGSSPSMNSSTSSGYGSQAVSISNLTNEDTLSLQSMSVDENTPGERFPFFTMQNNFMKFHFVRFSIVLATKERCHNNLHARFRSETLQSFHEG
jgi:kinesin family member 13